jgi:hypothetical protein
LELGAFDAFALGSCDGCDETVGSAVFFDDFDLGERDGCGDSVGSLAKGGIPFGEGADKRDGTKVGTAGGSIVGEALEGDAVVLGPFGLGALLLTGIVVAAGEAGGLRFCAVGIDVVDGAAVAGAAEAFEDDPFPDPFPDGTTLWADFE